MVRITDNKTKRNATDAGMLGSVRTQSASTGGNVVKLLFIHFFSI